MKREAGQTLVEAALVIPMMLAAFLCLLQIMILAHAKVMLQYAAFNAARAGVVQNGNHTAMRAAATISMLPVYCQTDTLANLVSTCAKVLPILLAGQAADDLENTLENFVISLGVNATLALPPTALVEVTVTNPQASDFVDTQGNALEEIDFDLPSRTDTPDPNAVRKTRLTIYVSALVPMQIPIGGALVDYFWLITRFMGGGHLPSDALNWIDAENAQGQTLEQILATAPPFSVPTSGPALREFLALNALKYLALMSHPVFLFPIETSYSMPMESNLFKSDFTGVSL